MSFRPTSGAAASIALAAALLQCSHPAKQPVEASNHYVKSDVCASCHADVYQTYQHTGMARAFYTPSKESVPNPTPYFHRASGTWFQIVEKQGAYYQRSWQIGLKGSEESVGETKIDYVMGSGNHVRTYIHRTARNTLIELPLAWYVEKGGTWALNPGFDTSHPPAGRRIGYDCMFCHNAYPAIPGGHDDPGSEPVYEDALPEGIDCQRCHGPGEKHVRAAQLPNSKVEDVRAAIVNPKKLSAERGMEVCLQCHLETTSFPLPNATRRFDRGPYSYQPGEKLSSFILFFDHAPGSGKENKFEIVSSAYRLRQAQCFIQSKGALTCTTCHNPHDIPHEPVAAEHYNGVCRQCHTNAFAALVAAGKHTQSKACIDCHMPKRRTEDVVHGVMTDHLIQRRKPSGDLLAERAEPHGKAIDYHGEVVPYGDSDELYTAMAQVIAKSNLEGGIPRLEAALAKYQPTRAEPYLEMGDAYRDTGQFANAAMRYEQTLARRPGSALVLRRLADALKNSGKQQEALDSLVKATQSEPSNPEAWYDLGLLQSDVGKKQEAIASLQKALQNDPEFAEAQNSLGAVLAESGQADQAEQCFRAALSMEPALAGAHGNLANLLAARNQLPEAAWHYERASDSALDQYNYAITLARMDKLADAQVHLEAALKADPNMAEAHDVLGGLLETKGRVDAAMKEYREAIRSRPDFGKAHLDLGTLLATRHDLKAAADELRKASTDANAEIREQAARSLQAIGARH
jgi:predicted CXXCH cytochrome family protein